MFSLTAAQLDERRVGLERYLHSGMSHLAGRVSSFNPFPTTQSARTGLFNRATCLKSFSWLHKRSPVVIVMMVNYVTLHAGIEWGH